MKRRPTPKNIKKETQECYNYRVKKYLARNYRKPKTRLGLQKK